MSNPAAENGELYFDETQERVGPRLDYSAFRQTRTGQMLGRRTGRGVVYAEVSRTEVEGTPFRVTLEFEGERLVRADLFLLQPADREAAKEGWGAWTEAGEQARRAAGEEWIARVFGRAPTLKPWVNEETGKEIIPAMPDENHPKHLMFSWGEVISYFDGKGGFPGILIRYGESGSRAGG